jgi:hypothetical protein
MSSPADFTVYNHTGTELILILEGDSWVEGDGSSVDDKTIAANSSRTFRIVAKTGHDGGLDMNVYYNLSEKPTADDLVAYFSIYSIKDPQNGESLAVVTYKSDLQVSALGYRSSPDDEDLRRIDLYVLQPDMDSVLYNQVSMKASHNSYQRNETITQQITWDSVRHYDCGCGGIELDISQSDEGNDWSVGHKASYDKHYRQLSQFLSDLQVWSNQNAGHDVITLYLDLKHVPDKNLTTFPADLDSYIRERLTPIYSPAAIIGEEDNLKAGALENGWASLGDLKGKFIICVTGSGDLKAAYAANQPKERLCFADKDIDADGTPDDNERIFFNFHIFHSDRDKWMKTFRDNSGKPNVIIRAYEANSADNWGDCLSSGCNLIATNEISNHDWAKVGSQRFAVIPNVYTDD